MGEARELSSHDDDLAALLARDWPAGLGDRVRYDHGKKTWHIWDGFRWAPDRIDLVYDMVLDRLLSWVSVATSESQVKAMMPLLNRPKKETVLKSLASRRGIAMAGDEWDPDPNLLAFANGVLDLNTGLFDKRPDPGLLLSRSTRQDYDPDAECPRFEQFLQEVMGGDEALVVYLAMVLGYSLFGWQREQKFWMWVGQGQNGKGTLAKTVAYALGDYADSPSAELYMKTKFGAARSDAARPDLLRLQGVRFTWMSEPSGGQFHEELLKAHTGDDPIQARDLYGKAASFTTFRPSHTIVFLTNNPPRTEDVGLSMQRRVKVIKFLQDFTGDKEDKGLEATMRAEAPGILALLTRMAKLWHELGDLHEPEQVGDWSSEYIEENDPISGFVTDACVVERGVAATAAEMWAAYQEWAGRNDIDVGSQTAFGSAMLRRFKRVRKEAGQVYLGVRPRAAIRGMDDAEA